MHDYMIDEITKVLIKNYAIRDEKELKSRTRKALREYGKNKIFSIWAVEDVIDRAKEHGKKLSMKQAREILDKIEHDFDFYRFWW